MPPEGVKILARNKRAQHEYFLEERFEAGIALVGSEVKSLREGRGSLAEAWADLRTSEVFLVGSHIAEYPQAGPMNHAPTRERKLLLHRREIDKLRARVALRGYTVIPVAIYLKDGLVKVEIALARGKEVRDKRATVRAREMDREARAAVRRHAKR
ncbi:MAG: SsrA-binding protein SmpB [Myxococcota bacterium]